MKLVQSTGKEINTGPDTRLMLTVVGPGETLFQMKGTFKEIDGELIIRGLIVKQTQVTHTQSTFITDSVAVSLYAL
jgi:hypothetical protein